MKPLDSSASIVGGADLLWMSPRVSKEMMVKQPICRKGSCSQAQRDPLHSSHGSIWNILRWEDLSERSQRAKRRSILSILIVLTSSGDGHPSLSFWDWAWIEGGPESTIASWQRIYLQEDSKGLAHCGFHFRVSHLPKFLCKNGKRSQHLQARF